MQVLIYLKYWLVIILLGVYCVIVLKKPFKHILGDVNSAFMTVLFEKSLSFYKNLTSNVLEYNNTIYNILSC